MTQELLKQKVKDSDNNYVRNIDILYHNFYHIISPFYVSFDFFSHNSNFISFFTFMIYQNMIFFAEMGFHKNQHLVAQKVLEPQMDALKMYEFHSIR